MVEAGLAFPQLDAIAYTRGPGLSASLHAGSKLAHALAEEHQLPLVSVHHMQAHALTPGLTEKEPLSFPYLALLVSGGHTLLLAVRSVSDITILATTLDSAVGDAFDKVSRLLQLSWSDGANKSPGAALESLAEHWDSNSIPLPVFPVAVPHQMAFSFSGLRSAVERYVDRAKQAGAFNQREAAAVAAGFQHAVVLQLQSKISKALSMSGQLPWTSLVVSGGVASNQYIRASCVS